MLGTRMSHTTTYGFCAMLALGGALAAGARAEEIGREPGFSGDLVIMADNTDGYPGDDEYGSALFYARGGYLHEVNDSVNIFAEGHLGQGFGASDYLLFPPFPLPPLTHWGVNELVYDTFGYANLRQLYIQSAFGEMHRAMAGKVDLSQIFGANEGGRGQWEGFVAPGLVTDPIIPFPPGPGGSLYHNMKLSDSTSVRWALADPDADWDNVFHKDGPFFIVELAQDLGDGGRIKAALWADEQKVSEWGPWPRKEWTPVGFSFDGKFVAGERDFFCRFGFRPDDLYRVDFAMSAGFVQRMADDRSLGFGILTTSWTKDYLDDLATSYGSVPEIQAEFFYRVKLPGGLDVIADAQVLFCPRGRSREFIPAGDKRDPIAVLSVRARLPF